MEGFQSEGATEGLQSAEFFQPLHREELEAEWIAEYFHDITQQHARQLDILLRTPEATPSPGGDGLAPGWCFDRADHRPWSSSRPSSAASAASTSAASTASSTKTVRDSSRFSPVAQWGEGPSTAPSPLSSPASLGSTDYSRVDWWVCGTYPSTLERTRSQAHRIGEPK
jgi:hypothetical protein